MPNSNLQKEWYTGANIQFIEKNGHPEWAILPYEIYEHLVADAELGREIALYDQAKKEDDGFRIPSEVTFKIIDGIHPVRAWREYRKMTQVDLATAASISKPYLSQIENNKRVGTLEVLKTICDILKVPLDVLDID